MNLDFVRDDSNLLSQSQSLLATVTSSKTEDSTIGQLGKILNSPSQQVQQSSGQFGFGHEERLIYGAWRTD